MNDQNLRRLTTSEAREIGRKGGLTRAANARRRKEHQEMWKSLLETEDTRGMTFLEIMDRALVKKAASGDTQAYEKIMEYAGLSVRLDLKEEEIRIKREALELQKKQTGSAPASEDKPDPRADILEQIRKAMEPTDGGNTDL